MVKYDKFSVSLSEKYFVVETEVYLMMNIHEFGKENNEIILLIHPSVVKWDYFENVIPLLQEKYHLLIPALPGYDFENDSDFTSVEQIASELNDWLSTRGYRNLYSSIWLLHGWIYCINGNIGTKNQDKSLYYGRRNHTVSASVVCDTFYRSKRLFDDDAWKGGWH